MQLGVLPQHITGLVSPDGGSRPFQLFLFLSQRHYPHVILADHGSGLPETPIQSHFLPLTQHHSDLAPTAHQIVNSVVQHIQPFTLWQTHQLRLSQVDQLLLVIHRRRGEKVHLHVAPRRQEGFLVPARVTWGERLVRGQTAQKLFLGLDEFVLLLDLRRLVTDSTFPPYLFRL